jgi:ubiquinone/menaquinone biosynthesis C-methylase UbiE
MAQFHFVEDYERHVANLKAKHPLDVAMSLAVGGGYEEIGEIASEALLYAGLKSGMSVFDFGCGSGRVAHAVAAKVKLPAFLGTDIVQDLLDYAATKTPSHYRFVLHREVSIPADDQSFDMAYAFSVFTHLLQTECFAYLRDIGRTLKSGGRIVASFLELAEPVHWPIFLASVGAPHLNTFIERSQWQVWAKHSGLVVLEFIGGTESRWKGKPLGQSIVILEKATCA